MKRIKLRRWTPIPVDLVSFAALLVVAFIMGTLFACASVPGPVFMGCRDDCVVLNVDNGQLGEVVVYLNSARFATVSGGKQVTLMVPRIRLDGGGCMSVRVRSISGHEFQSAKECIVGNGHFELVVSPLLSASSLAPYRE